MAMTTSRPLGAGTTFDLGSSLFGLGSSLLTGLQASENAKTISNAQNTLAQLQVQRDTELAKLQAQQTALTTTAQVQVAQTQAMSTDKIMQTVMIAGGVVALIVLLPTIMKLFKKR